MIPAPLPPNEAERIAALTGCSVLDTAPEPAFDHIAQLASQICETPMALVSLVDESRQWFKAKVGLDVPETPRNISFCAHAVLGDQPLIIPDATRDERFADNPLVLGEPHVRFYAGIPLVLAPGIAVGSLCVIDRVPRELTEGQLGALKMLAKQVTNELSLRRELVASRRPAQVQEPTVGSLPTTVSEGPEPLALPQTGVRRLPVALGELVEGRYLLEKVLGVGGMGIVTAARDTSSGREVAIKFMLPDALRSREAVQRFVREAQALRRLVSDHVARLLDVGNLPNGVPFIVMERLNGEDLDTRLRREGALEVEAALRIVLQACRGIEVAHGHDILHRDLKPGNLFLSRDAAGNEQVKILDFGISKMCGAELQTAQTVLTTAATTIGSPHYMSPEQMISPESVDARSDVWSVGVILYQLLSGRLPFEGSSFPAICARVLAARPAPLSELSPRVSAKLSTLIARCLEKERCYRYASMAELITALEAAAES